MTQPTPLHWLITGASSGFGQALTQAVLARGDRVAGTFRQAAAAREFEARSDGRGVGIELDVTDATRILAAVAEAVSRLGHVDILVNNAGHGQFGAIEDVSDSQIRELFETNFFGLLGVTRALLPHLRSRGRGQIANVSSLAGFRAFSTAGIYSASKFAVEGLSEALSLEMKPFGIGVTIIEPGGFRTQFATTSMDLETAVSPPYRESLGPVHHYLTQVYPGTERGSPAKAAAAIVAALTAPKPPRRLVLGPDALQGVRQKIDEVSTELTRWEHLSTSTDFDDRQPWSHKQHDGEELNR